MMTGNSAGRIIAFANPSSATQATGACPGSTIAPRLSRTPSAMPGTVWRIMELPAERRNRSHKGVAAVARGHLSVSDLT